MDPNPRSRTRYAGLGSGLCLALALLVGPATQAGVISLQEGVNGYSGTQDVLLFGMQPNTNFGQDPSLVVDFNPDPFDIIQSLIRFDGLIGNGSGQIPLNSTILGATLSLTNNNSPGFEAVLHRMLVPWTEASTFNSLGNGIQIGSEAVSDPDDSVSPVPPAATDPLSNFSVIDSVQAWANGQTNHGWLIASNSGDGFVFFSSEAATASDRPLLTVSFTPPAAPTIPEPAGWLAVGLGVGGLALARRRLRDDRAPQS